MAAKIRNILGVTILTLCLSSCASTYKPIVSEGIHYTMNETDENIELGYKYDVLEMRGNRKYAKKENKRGINIVAVKIINNNEVPINIGKHARFFQGNLEITPVETEVVVKKIKQGVPIYLLYSLIFLNFTQCNGYDCETSSYPIGLPIAAGNMIVASNANARFKSEFAAHDITKKIVAPGQTVTGLLAVRNANFSRITLKIEWDNVYADVE